MELPSKAKVPKMLTIEEGESEQKSKENNLTRINSRQTKRQQLHQIYLCPLIVKVPQRQAPLPRSQVKLSFLSPY